MLYYFFCSGDENSKMENKELKVFPFWERSRWASLDRQKSVNQGDVGVSPLRGHMKYFMLKPNCRPSTKKKTAIHKIGTSIRADLR
jgi:hypothetical protein